MTKSLALDAWRIASILDQELTTGPLKGVFSEAIRCKRYQQLLAITVPHDLSCEDLRISRQIQALFKKSADYCRKDADSVAWKAFENAEMRCRIANRRLDFYSLYPERLDETLMTRVKLMRKFIALVLGDFRTFLDGIPSEVRLTGGATSSSPRVRSSPPLKIKRRQRITAKAIPFLTAYSTWLGRSISPIIVSHNRITFVPKNYKTSRTIACEPEGLLPFQLACDTLIKRRLRKHGVNLSDQEWNQTLSRAYSITDTGSTIDLAQASDSLCKSALEFLFPKEFADLFLRLRSPEYQSKYGSGRYAKYASMGNGLTFPLESLVFASCVFACGGKLGFDSAVYGDDIICPVSITADVIDLLAFLGFRINPEKTFTSGPFRESCGTDWYRGVNITPFYLRRTPVYNTEKCLLINSIALRFFSDAIRDYLTKVTRSLRLLRVPEGQDLTEGVWASISDLYSERLLRRQQKPRESHAPFYWGITYKRYSLVPKECSTLPDIYDKCQVFHMSSTTFLSRHALNALIQMVDSKDDIWSDPRKTGSQDRLELIHTFRCVIATANWRMRDGHTDAMTAQYLGWTWGLPLPT